MSARDFLRLIQNTDRVPLPRRRSPIFAAVSTTLATNSKKEPKTCVDFPPEYCSTKSQCAPVPGFQLPPPRRFPAASCPLSTWSARDPFRWPEHPLKDFASFRSVRPARLCDAHVTAILCTRSGGADAPTSSASAFARKKSQWLASPFTQLVTEGPHFPSHRERHSCALSGACRSLGLCFALSHHRAAANSRFRSDTPHPGKAFTSPRRVRPQLEPSSRVRRRMLWPRTRRFSQARGQFSPNDSHGLSHASPCLLVPQCVCLVARLSVRLRSSSLRTQRAALTQVPMLHRPGSPLPHRQPAAAIDSDAEKTLRLVFARGVGSDQVASSFAERLAPAVRGRARACSALHSDRTALGEAVR